jgi:hypothetical protein
MRLCLSFALALSSLVSMQAQERAGLSQNAIPVMKSDSSGSSSNALVVRIRDKCDPATFNAKVAPDSCRGDGNVTFDQFIAELMEDKKVGAWRFNPDNTDPTLGHPVILESRAGETHTFTKVARFGGGVVDALNELSGNLTFAPECVDLTVAGPAPGVHAFNAAVLRIPSGAIEYGPSLSGGDKVQCCVHPWMRLTVNATGK